jgi:hypothetical protein
MSHATKKSGGSSKKQATKPATSTKVQAAAKPADPDLVPLTEIDKQRKAGKSSGKGKATKEPKAAKGTAAKAPKADKGMSCLDAAAAVLKAKGEPMRCKDLINEMFAKKLWHSDAPTPAATLYSAILREMGRKGAKARFRKTDRGHFALNA